MKREIRPTTAVIPCPVVLLSVKGPERPNIITVSWVANVCSDPPMVVVAIRPKRHSNELIKKAGDFVLNIPSSDQIEACVFAGTKSGRDYDKFVECGLTAVPSLRISSPAIAECPINIECIVTRTTNLGAHDMFIAQIVTVRVDDLMIDDKEKINAERLRLFTYLPLTGEYWRLGEKIR